MADKSLPDAKRRKVEEEEGQLPEPAKTSPTTIVTWNCNGFKHRCLYNRSEIENLLASTNDPDLIAIQEAKLKRASETRPDSPCSEDLQHIRSTLKQVFRDYTPFWSLAPTRHHGTLTLVHHRLGFDAANAAFSCQSAIDLLLRYFQLTRKDVGLPVHPSTASNDVDNKPSIKKAKQTSMTAFFATKKKSSSSSSSSTTSLMVQKGKHQEDGRFQFFVFPDRCLLQVYTPNNGHKVESNERRAKWDKEIKEFLLARQKILQVAKKPHRQLVWCGDFNCALAYQDGTHWELSKSSHNNGGTIEEWWLDETKSLGSSVVRDVNRSPQDIGTASFTFNERKHLRESIEQADLLDVWRVLNPVDETPSSTPTKDYWTKPFWTWRGHLSQPTSSFVSKYEGKGQRIDYFLLSPSATAMETVEKCEILGYGTERHGFCGSDHCPVVLCLKNGNSGEQETQNDSDK